MKKKKRLLPMIATAKQSTANWDVSDSVKLGYLERERVCRERKTEKEEGKANGIP